jgi:predicted small lipoprotein YifL
MKKQPRILGSIAKPQGPHHRGRLIASILLATWLLGACGQKGPLYLPSPAQGASSASPAASKATTP